MSNISGHAEWYAAPLSAEDLLAGGVLVFIAAFFIPLYSLVAIIMLRHDKEVVGFRFLFSSAIADVLLLFNYGFWPGLTILLKSEIIAPYMRQWIQIYLDWAWFSACYHYSLVAWSRFAAIRFPHAFRTQSKRTSYLLCLGCYVFSLIQVLSTHFQSWYVTFYYEPYSYGMLAENFDKYINNGQSLFFLTFHSLMVIVPIMFYTYAIFLLIRNNHTGHHYTSRQHHVESRLIIPCIINSSVFIVGQIVITVGTGEGKWATWTVMLLFSANSAINPLLYLSFSAVIRTRIVVIFGLRPYFKEKMHEKIRCYSAVMGNQVNFSSTRNSIFSLRGSGNNGGKVSLSVPASSPEGFHRLLLSPNSCNNLDSSSRLTYL